MAWLAIGPGTKAGMVILQMAGTGLVCTLTYKWPKAETSRLRPYQVNEAIQRAAAPLDPFSFPSGTPCTRLRLP